MISVIIPAYNEEGMITKTAETISAILASAAIDHELIFVNDGSKDSTWDKIQKAAGKNPAVRGICFSRNFGKEAAMFAGMYYAKGACCVVIDCDLQHPPEKILEMYRLWEQGYEIIEAVKTDRGKESVLHRLSAQCFYKIISKVTDIDMSRASDFKLLDRKAVNVLLNMKEKNAFFRALSSWIGFKTTQVEFEVKGTDCGRIQMVHARTDQVCNFQCHVFLCGAYADRHDSWHSDAVCIGGSGNYSIIPEVYRNCPRRIYNRHYYSAVYRQYHYDQPGDHRVLYCKNLRRNQGTAAVCSVGNLRKGQDR